MDWEGNSKEEKEDLAIDYLDAKKGWSLERMENRQWKVKDDWGFQPKSPQG